MEMTGEIMLHQNIPDPFDKKTEISFFIHEGGNYKLNIYDSKKKIIRILNNGYLEAGTHRFTWNGISSDGNYVKDGLYNFSLEGNGTFTVRKLQIKRDRSNILNRIINFKKKKER